jgi:CRP-like cAMP-binding protein
LLYLEGDDADGAWFVKRGTVALYRSRCGDTEATVRAVRFAGSFIGLESLVRPTYADTARAVGEITVCGISREGLDHWIGPPSSPARTALELTLREENTDRLSGTAGHGSAISRVADWLAREGPCGVALELPRQIVADLLGMRPETLSRAIAALRDRGAITANRTHITIVDSALLLAPANA